MAEADGRPRIAISACLLGELVRYDGDHRRSEEIVREIGPHVEWWPLCPEVGAGMGVPREPVELIPRAADAAVLRMVGVRTRRDWTGALHRWTDATLAELREAGIRGAILKSRSPSCGVGSTPRRDPGGRELGLGHGLFALWLAESFPELPLVEDAALDTTDARAMFLRRVRAFDPGRLGAGRPPA